MVIGGGVWSYANGASSVLASQYHEESMELVDTLGERVMIEHITNNATHLMIWLYNYGESDVELDIYANLENIIYSTDTNNPINIQNKKNNNATIAIPISGGDIIGINIYTRRQNHVYYSYIAHT